MPQRTILSMDKRYVCVYCGYSGKVIDYRILLKSGLYSRKLFKCPDCNNTMFKGTLITKITNKYWGAWIYVNTKLYGRRFTEKVQWEILKKRLWDYGISREFWEGFNYIKNNYYKIPIEKLNELSVLIPINRQTTLD